MPSSSQRQSEKEFAASLAASLKSHLTSDPGFADISVNAEVDLRYSAAVMSLKMDDDDDYRSVESYATKDTAFTTDILVWEQYPERRWVPRVVIECKIRAVTTHDVLVYGAKAEKHRNVFPYLRYGLLIGEMGSVPTRVPLHGDRFDFMVAWPDAMSEADFLREFGPLIASEIKASRTLQGMITHRRAGGRVRYRVFHRPLVVKPDPDDPKVPNPSGAPSRARELDDVT